MKEQDFFDYLDKAFHDVPLEEIHDALKEMHSHWISEYEKRRFDKYQYCPKCKKYSLKDDFRFFIKEELFIFNKSLTLETPLT